MVSDLRIFVWIVVIAISIVLGNLALDSGSQAGRGYGFSSLGAETAGQEKEDGEEKGDEDDWDDEGYGYDDDDGDDEGVDDYVEYVDVEDDDAGCGDDADF